MDAIPGKNKKTRHRPAGDKEHGGASSACYGEWFRRDSPDVHHDERDDITARERAVESRRDFGRAPVRRKVEFAGRFGTGC